jgi:hypothetical protein
MRQAEAPHKAALDVVESSDLTVSARGWNCQTAKAEGAELLAFDNSYARPTDRFFARFRPEHSPPL